MQDAPDMIREARKRIDDVARKREALQAQLSALDEEQRRFEAFIDVYIHLTPPVQPNGSKATSQLAERLQHMTLAEGAEVLLEGWGGRAPMVQIVAALVDAGKIKGDPQQAYGTMVKTMDKKKDVFYKVSRGHWGLVKYRQDEAKPGAPIPIIPGIGRS